MRSVTPILLVGGGLYLLSRLGEASSLSQSDYFVTGFSITDLGFPEVDSEVTVEIQNSSSREIRTGNTFLQVYMNDRNIGLISDTQSRGVDPISRKHLIFPLKIQVTRLISMLGSAWKNKQVDLKIEGHIEINGFSAPIKYEKQIELNLKK